MVLNSIQMFDSVSKLNFFSKSLIKLFCVVANNSILYFSTMAGISFFVTQQIQHLKIQGKFNHKILKIQILFSVWIESNWNVKTKHRRLFGIFLLVDIFL